MAANTSPIFGATPNIFSVVIPTTAIMTASNAQGSVNGTNTFIAFTAVSNGSFVQKTRFIPAATTASVSTVASTLRIHLSASGSNYTITTASAFLIGEQSVPVVVTSHQSNAVNYYDYPLNFAIESGSFLLVSQHVAQTANSQWEATTFGFDY